MSDRVFWISPLFDQSSPEEISAKQLTVEKTDWTMAVEANGAWHSQLPNMSDNSFGFGDLHLYYAATFHNVVYGVAIWTRPISANRMKWNHLHLAELRRLAIPDYAPKFTATRMLGQMARAIKKEFPDICRLVSYQVTDVHTGTIYKAANWKCDSAQEKYQTWMNRKEGRIESQNVSPKRRWIYQLHECDCKNTIRVHTAAQEAMLDGMSL